MALQHNITIREVVICSACDGWGEVDISIDIHAVDMQPCSKCEGDGRLVKRTDINYSRISNVRAAGDSLGPRQPNDQKH